MGLGSRLADRTKVPRRWWYPIETCQKFASGEEWQRQYDETSNTIRRVMLALVAFSLYCGVSLGTPDVSLLSADATINLPFANTKISYSAFLLLGPSVLIGLSVYLHIFVGYQRTLGTFDDRHAMPYIFNMQSRTARLISGFLFYWLIPLVLFGFFWKASPRPTGPALFFVAMAVTGKFLWLAIRRWSLSRRRISYIMLWIFEVCVLVVLLGMSTGGGELPRRQLILIEANLKGQDLAWATLQKANLFGANLQGANLFGATLQGANLEGANLQGAHLQGANLRGANLRGANLRGADLQKATLRGANLFRANLQKANLGGANLLGVRGLKQAQLNEACVNGKTILSGMFTRPAIC